MYSTAKFHNNTMQYKLIYAINIINIVDGQKKYFTFNITNYGIINYGITKYDVSYYGKLAFVSIFWFQFL